MDFWHYVISRHFTDLSHPPQILLYRGPGQIEGHVKMHHMTFSFKKKTCQRHGKWRNKESNLVQLKQRAAVSCLNGRQPHALVALRDAFRNTYKRKLCAWWRLQDNSWLLLLSFHLCVGTESKLSSLHANCLYPVNHLVGSQKKILRARICLSESGSWIHHT